MTVRDPFFSEQSDVKDREKTDHPKKYRVILLNDDYTPMEFVVEILITVFCKSENDAVQIMMNVHQTGKGICGTYSHEIAETKVTRVNELAVQNEHPLKSMMEEE